MVVEKSEQQSAGREPHHVHLQHAIRHLCEVNRELDRLFLRIKGGSDEGQKTPEAGSELSLSEVLRISPGAILDEANAMRGKISGIEEELF